MPAVYPEAPKAKPTPEAFDEGKCVDEIIALRTAEPKMTRIRAGGKLFHVVGGTIPDIYRVWDEIEAERVARRKIIVLTPSVFFSNAKAVANQYKMGRNIRNLHLCLITRDFLRNQGFDTHLPRPTDIHKPYFAVKRLT